jgi:hypothetical protein
MIKNNLLRITAGIVVVIVLLASCYYDKSDLLYGNNTHCNGVNSKFSTVISPMVQSKCSYAGCHDAGTGAGGTVLENYSQISASANKINQQCVASRAMPPIGYPALSDSDRISLQCWIDAGAPNN